jgi:ABC-type branched-subunit amino acid transport system substrate-binding protein
MEPNVLSNPPRWSTPTTRSLAALAGLVAAGCTPSVLPYTECTTNFECQEVMGYGSTCEVETGLCATVEMHPRCDGTYPESLTFPVKQDEQFLIASLFGRSDAHKARRDAAQLAVMQINDNQGVDGRDFAILHCNYDEDPSIDDLDQTGAVESITTWLADDVGIPAIVGPAASSLSQAVYNNLNGPANLDTLVVSPSATAPSLTEIHGGGEDLFWRTAPPDGGQGIAIARDMRETFDPLGETVYRTAPVDHLAILYQEGAYGEGLTDVVFEELERLGGSSSLFPFNTSNLGQQVAQIATSSDGPFDEVLVISSDSQDYSAFLAAANNNGAFADLPLFFSDGGRTADIFGEVGDLRPNIRGSVPSLPTGVVFQSFAASFSAAFLKDSNDHSFVPHSYDAAMLTIYAHAWAVHNESRVSGTELVQGFRQFSNGPETDIDGYTSTLSAMQSGNSVDIEGASGALDYKGNGELPSTIEVWTLSGSGQSLDFEQEYIFIEE